jgi:hypothetical protein
LRGDVVRDAAEVTEPARIAYHLAARKGPSGFRRRPGAGQGFRRVVEPGLTVWIAHHDPETSQRLSMDPSVPNRNPDFERSQDSLDDERRDPRPVDTATPGGPLAAGTDPAGLGDRLLFRIRLSRKTNRWHDSYARSGSRWNRAAVTRVPDEEMTGR